MTALHGHRYIFGPVQSRRLGLSLGIDVVPMKTCTYNCIYCQLGRTVHQTLERAEYVPMREVMTELSWFVENGGKADYITFSGSGEPTLHSKLGEMIAAAKQISDIPVAVLTCGALLFDPQVRRELALADVVLPTLNTASSGTFQKINRPHGKLRLAEIIEGLKQFRREFRGKMWLEVMLAKGINDNAEETARLQRVIAGINPDKIHLNTVVRPPAETIAQPLSERELLALQARFGPNAEIIVDGTQAAKRSGGVLAIDELIQSLARHPATLEEICSDLSCKHEIVWAVLNALIKVGILQMREHQGKKFYAVSPDTTTGEEYLNELSIIN
jgi:wyosine [tRNA(Phe)-imidazoG37] synthetase (radical SAM superfamily)